MAQKSLSLCNSWEGEFIIFRNKKPVMTANEPVRESSTQGDLERGAGFFFLLKGLLAIGVATIPLCLFGGDDTLILLAILIVFLFWEDNPILKL